MLDAEESKESKQTIRLKRIRQLRAATCGRQKHVMDRRPLCHLPPSNENYTCQWRAKQTIDNRNESPLTEIFIPIFVGETE